MLMGGWLGEYSESREGLIMGGRNDCVCLSPPVTWVSNEGGVHTGSFNSLSWSSGILVLVDG